MQCCGVFPLSNPHTQFFLGPKHFQGTQIPLSPESDSGAFIECKSVRMHLSVIKGEYTEMLERGFALLSLVQAASRCAHLCVMRESWNACASGRDGKARERKRKRAFCCFVYLRFSPWIPTQMSRDERLITESLYLTRSGVKHAP